MVSGSGDKRNEDDGSFNFVQIRPSENDSPWLQKIAGLLGGDRRRGCEVRASGAAVFRHFALSRITENEFAGKSCWMRPLFTVRLTGFGETLVG